MDLVAIFSGAQHPAIPVVSGGKPGAGPKAKATEAPLAMIHVVHQLVMPLRKPRQIPNTQSPEMAKETRRGTN